ncbi:hypothetical protein [Herbaspirillum hiltneri]|uniref:hypothetical protein n=1 Tax=Herbaspirillum hiltneri TaxID=341045 RepID=UPI001187551F|nr:hypothetical protein [Herbaspirillum hiltneri]
MAQGVFVDNLQRFERGQAGIGFEYFVGMHVWFDSENLNGYDSHPLQMLTFSLHRIRQRWPGNRQHRTTRFFIFQKSP